MTLGPDTLSATSYQVSDHVATLTLDRPHRRNAWTGRMHAEYRWAMTEAENDPDVRVVVVTGAESDDGRHAFCVGGDSQALEGHSERGSYDDGLGEEQLPMPDVAEAFAADFAFQLGMSTPVVAAVNGPAAGVGLAIVCFADVRYGVEGAKLTTAAPKLGFPAEYGMSWMLPRLVGAGRAADWLITGRAFTTEEARDAGLLSAVYPRSEFTALVNEHVVDLALHTSPASVAVTKRQLWSELLSDDPAASVSESIRLLGEMIGQSDSIEGIRALSERRRPEF